MALYTEAARWTTPLCRPIHLIPDKFTAFWITFCVDFQDGIWASE